MTGAHARARMNARMSARPPARDYSVMAYDSVRDRMLLFGGADSNETPFGDLWAYDLGRDTWSELKPTGLRPGARAWHAMAFDNALWGGRVADPGLTDPETSAIREVAGLVRQDERLVPLLLPVGDGLLTAVKRG